MGGLDEFMKSKPQAKAHDKKSGKSSFIALQTTGSGCTQRAVHFQGTRLETALLSAWAASRLA
jgi:hypothetical protein